MNPAITFDSKTIEQKLAFRKLRFGGYSPTFIKGHTQFYMNSVKGYPMSKVLSDFGVPDNQIRQINPKKWVLSNIDILIITQDGLDDLVENNSETIQNFVSHGGICWILHQNSNRWTSHWLPQKLSEVSLSYRHIELSPSKREYICPWIIKRQHPIFNYPNYLDEGDFIFWEVKINKKLHRTTAFSAITKVHGWDVLAKFADQTCNNGAMIMQANLGKGLYLWTQMFSPEVVWKQHGERCRQTWERLLENILIYFVNFKEGNLFQMKSSVKPWSVLAGANVTIKTIINSPLEVKDAYLVIKQPSGSQKRMKLHPVETQKKGRCEYMVNFIPHEAGEYMGEIRVSLGSQVESSNHIFFKVTKGWTPYRFVEHIHSRDWIGSPQSVGTLFGAARFMGYDVIPLSVIHEGFGNYSFSDDIKIIDNPRCRFLYGREFHPFSSYGNKFYHHIVAIGVPPGKKFPGTIDNASDDKKYIKETIKWIHDHGGIAIAAHPPDDYWMDYNFDGVEIDDEVMPDKTAWDKMLKRGRRTIGFSSIDLFGITRMLLDKPNSNIVWLNKPLTKRNFIQAIRHGRVVALRKIDLVWFDIEGQAIGDTLKLHAAGKVSLHFRVESQHLIKEVRIIKGGDILKVIKIGKKKVDSIINDRVNKDTYYRLEVKGEDSWAYTNPIYVELTLKKWCRIS